MVWPLVKNAIEQSIRKVTCKVYWQDLRASSPEKDLENKCCEVVINTFWTDVSKLDAIASAGGEVDEEDDTDADDDDGGGGGGAGGAGGGAGGGNSRGGGGAGGAGGIGGPVTPPGGRREGR
jgi:uncharacterized membrane protein YgcG